MKRKLDIFVFSASSGYGSGGRDGGWADMLKRQLHSKMFGPGGIGERYRLHLLAMPGASVGWLTEHFYQLLNIFAYHPRSVAVVNIGLNDTKASNDPDNFVTLAHQFRNEMGILLSAMKESVDHVICLGYAWVDESKMPLINEYGSSYFTNDRIAEFNQILEQICSEFDIEFVAVGVSKKVWIERYICDDGLHPNHLGHSYLFALMLNALSKHL